MSSSPGAVRQRGGKRGTTPNPDTRSDLANGSTNEKIAQLKSTGKDVVQRDWDYKLALAVLTALAFVTRFWGISHPNQVVFDEVHFGKVWLGALWRVIERVANGVASSHPTTFNAHTSSMSILPLASCCSHSPAGWLATMDLSSSKTLATRTLRIRSRTSHIDRCPRSWVL